MSTEANRFDHLFTRATLRRELKKRSIQGVSIRAVANASALLLTLGSVAILARLLKPEEFGLFAMVIAVTEFARSFMELGLGTVTVQREDIGHKEVSTLFWINLGFGIVLMLGVVSLSPVVAWFYNDNRLYQICQALSVYFLFAGLTVQPRSILERQMRFGSMAIVNLGATFLSVCFAILLAMKGTGVWALVAREVSRAFFYAAGVLICCKWLPSLPRREWFNDTIKSSFKFGIDLSGFGILQYLTQNLDRVLIGRVCGAASLGFYSQASKLAKMPVEHIRMIILGVALSPLSALVQEPNRYSRYFGKLLLALCFIYMPILVFLAVCSYDIVLAILGQAWLSAVPLFLILVAATFVRPIVAVLQLIMLSCGHSRRYLAWGLVNAACILASFFMGVHWGAKGVAYGYMISSYGILFWSMRYCVKETPINTNYVIRIVLLPTLSSLFAGIVSLFAIRSLSLDCLSYRLFFNAIVVFIVHLSVWNLFPYGRRELREFWSYGRELFRAG